jgi:hypothetical protein
MGHPADANWEIVCNEDREADEPDKAPETK